MKGINFLFSEEGEKKAVQIDLEILGELWEDFYDSIVAKERENDELISFDYLKQEIKV